MLVPLKVTGSFLGGYIILPPFIYDQAYSVDEYDHHGNKSRQEFDGILHGKVRSLVVVKGIALEPPKRSPLKNSMALTVIYHNLSPLKMNECPPFKGPVFRGKVDGAAPMHWLIMSF